jgi:branched-chain amino acid transport system permease protein
MESGIFHTTYQADMTLRRTYAQKIRIAIFLLFMLAFPFFANPYTLSLANLIGIATIGAIGLNILVGYTGQISLGQGGFLAVGAYTAGILTARLGIPWYASTLVACLFTALVGAIFGIPSLRLKGLYLAIATLAAQEIIIWVVTHWKGLTGGVDALVVPDPTLFGIQMNTDFNFYWLVWALAGLTALAAINLFRTHYGRAFIAIRDQDIAAEVMGVNIFRYKLLAFAVSSFFVGLAGALTAHYRSIVTWERFTIDVSVLYLAMIIIGGLGSVSGSLLPQILSNLGRASKGYFPFIDSILPFIQQAAFGLVIILFLIFEPEGLSKLWRNIKDYFRLWPFSY